MLQIGQEIPGAVRTVIVLILGIFHHAHDFEIRRVLAIVGAEMLADGVGAVEVHLRELLVDDGNTSRCWCVMFVDGSSLQQACSNRLKVIGSDAEP